MTGWRVLYMVVLTCWIPACCAQTEAEGLRPSTARATSGEEALLGEIIYELREVGDGLRRRSACEAVLAAATKGDLNQWPAPGGLWEDDAAAHYRAFLRSTLARALHKKEEVREQIEALRRRMTQDDPWIAGTPIGQIG